jgi:hypothetical protein
MEKEIRTMDGVLVERERVETVAMCLSGCSERRLKVLGIQDKFIDYAERFIMFVTEDELKDFVAHHVAIEMFNLIAKS